MVYEVTDLWRRHKEDPFDFSTYSSSVVVTYVPTCAGGVYLDEVKRFYAKYFSPARLVEKSVISTAYDTQRYVVHEEAIVSLKIETLDMRHEHCLSWILPGVKWQAVGDSREIEFPWLTVAEFGEDGLLKSKRCYWDQAGVLKQLGLFTPKPGVWGLHADYSTPVCGAEQVEGVLEPKPKSSNPLTERLIKGTFSVRGTSAQEGVLSSILHGDETLPPVRTSTRVLNPGGPQSHLFDDQANSSKATGRPVDPRRYETHLCIEFNENDAEVQEAARLEHERARRNRPQSAAMITKSHLENGFVGVDQEVSSEEGGHRTPGRRPVSSVADQRETHFTLRMVPDGESGTSGVDSDLAGQVQQELGIARKAHDHRANLTHWSLSGEPADDETNHENGHGTGRRHILHNTHEEGAKSFSGKKVRPPNPSQVNFVQPPPKERPSSRVLNPPGGRSNLSLG